MGRTTSPSRHRDRLPGVGGPDDTLPRTIYNPAADIEQARRRAAIRDLIDIGVLIAVDVFFLSWPAARIPFLTRDHSLWVLVLLHVLVVASWLRTRWYARWRARRVASTWSEAERRQFRGRR